MATWLIITLTIIIVLFLVLFGGFVFFMYKDLKIKVDDIEKELW